MQRLSLPLFVMLLFVVAACGQAQTAWPGYMHALKPDLPDSPVPAMLPADVAITPPAADLPPARAHWSGSWQGWACQGQACDVKVAVESVRTDGATVVYAGASAAATIVERGEARFVGDELHLPVKTGATVVLRLRADGDMELSIWRPGAQLLSAGVLTQKPLGAPRRRSVERLATPWTEDGQPVSLVLVVYRPPQGAGPWPTLVVHHGSTGNGDRPELFAQAYTSLDLVKHFTAQGWQVLFPQRRGRGGSGGRYDEGFTPDHARYSCDPRDSLPGFERALEDLDVVMRHVAARPDVDPKRVLLSGVSRGGALASVYAGTHPTSAAGVLNFVGGWMGDACPQVEAINPVLFRRAAAYPRPMLWLYGSRDSFYSLRHSRANFAAFQGAGGQGRFVAYELPPGQNGHYIVGRPDLWGAEVDAYVRRVVAP